jgi:hypothetical protein
MKVLSIDVGIKNLAFCLFENSGQDYKITKWDTVDISEQEEILLCGISDKNILCNKLAKYKKDDLCFCLKHAKKQQFFIPKSEHKPAFINKQKIQKLYEIAASYKIELEPKSKKVDITKLINEHINNTYFQSIISKNASEVNLINIGANIKTKFNKLFENEGIIEYVIIENQISPIATRMKTIQGMIVQYFVMSNVQVDHIEFISAANKLKGFTSIENTGVKTKYSDRKKLGIEKCLEIISADLRFNEHINYFNSHKKKDDLSDSFLQGLWFLKNKKLLLF